MLQEIRRAVSSNRSMDDGTIVIEGPHLIEEAKRGHWQLEQVLATPEAMQKFGLHDAIEVSSKAFEAISATEHSQGVLGLVRPRKWTWGELIGGNALVVILDGIQDPGNAGTLVRSAEAFGATGLVFVAGCVRVSNGKFLRATAGSIFRMPYLENAHPNALRGLKLYALTAKSEMNLSDAELRESCGLITGNEGAGISFDLADRAQGVRIPAVQVESLNAAVACSIALFEAFRQRSRS